MGEGSSNQGEIHEAINFAAIHRLPVIFVGENNGYAISVPLDRQVGHPVSQVAFIELHDLNARLFTPRFELFKISRVSLHRVLRKAFLCLQKNNIFANEITCRHNDILSNCGQTTFMA